MRAAVKALSENRRLCLEKKAAPWRRENQKCYGAEKSALNNINILRKAARLASVKPRANNKMANMKRDVSALLKIIKQTKMAYLGAVTCSFR